MAKKDLIIIVNARNRKIGLRDKTEAHLGRGILHRAFVVFIFDTAGKLLLQQRSKKKMLWPLYWDCSCASHPRVKERCRKSGERRLKEELGFTASLRNLGKFQYAARYKDIGAERELVILLTGRYEGKIKPNQKEVADFKWVDINSLNKDIAKHPQIYTPWLKKGLKIILKNRLCFLKRRK